MTTPMLIADTVRQRYSGSSESLNVFWASVPDDRDAAAQELRISLSDLPLAVIVVRKDWFRDPNTVMGDVAAILEQHRDACIVAFQNSDFSTRLGLVLVARSELRVGQCSSPIVLPEWVPVLGGHQVHCTVQDLTWALDVSLDAKEVGVPDLRRSLFELERALVRRLVQVHGQHPGSGEDLIRYLLTPKDPPWPAVLAQAMAKSRTVMAPDSFRPNVKDGHFLVTRIRDRAERELGLTNFAAALDRALDLGSVRDAPGRWEPLAAALTRPSQRGRTDDHATSRILIECVTNAGRYSTCSAHSDQYPRYPVQLLALWVADLRRGLDAWEGILNKAWQAHELNRPAAELQGRHTGNGR
jgi:hypothetical protein